MSDNYLSKKIIDRHPPPWHGWFSFCNIPAPVDGWVIRIACPIHPDDLLTEDVYVPYHKRSTGEIISAFHLHLALGSPPIVIFATDFNSENRGTIKKRAST